MSAVNVTARLTETITVKRPTGHTSAGDWTYGANFTAPARVQRDTQEVQDAEGRRVSNATILITTTELLVGDMVWLAEDSTADADACRRILNVKRRVALDGTVTHYTATLS
jgi:predicted nucleic acid-binding Zn ribbon protein